MNALDTLRAAIAGEVDARRYRHILAVEEECVRLAALFSLSDSDTAELRAAALLHDLTKCKGTKEQLALCQKHSIALTADDLASPAILHAYTSAAEAKERFAPFATERVVRAIARHTVGAEDLTLFEALLYLADYIEPTRAYDDCVALRAFFESAVPSEAHLTETILLSYDLTISALLSERRPIHPETVRLRSLLLCRNKECADLVIQTEKS